MHNKNFLNVPWPELALVAIHRVSIIMTNTLQVGGSPHCPASDQQYRLRQHQSHYHGLIEKRNIRLARK